MTALWLETKNQIQILASCSLTIFFNSSAVDDIIWLMTTEYKPEGKKKIWIDIQKGFWDADTYAYL